MNNEWIKTEDRLPTRLDSSHDSSEYIDCYIFIDNQVKERPWNIHHECWDDRGYDDFEYEATEPTHWMKAPDFPLPPNAT
jgi:predicted metal-dependent hydrolase